MVANLINYLQSRRINDLPVRLLILSSLSSLVVSLVVAWPSMLRLIHVGFSRIFYLVLFIVVFGALFFGVLTPMFVGQKNANRIFVWFGQAGEKVVLWLGKVVVLFIVNTCVLMLKLFVAAVSPDDVTPKVGEALSHYMERSADMLLHP